jgi:hypothetical protein
VLDAGAGALRQTRPLSFDASAAAVKAAIEADLDTGLLCVAIPHRRARLVWFGLVRFVGARALRSSLAGGGGASPTSIHDRNDAPKRRDAVCG